MLLHHRMVVATGFCVISCSSPVLAAYAIPNTLTNGEVADAVKVMENPDADAAAKKAGTPQGGAFVFFVDPDSVTGGNLSGDVTTWGGTAATLMATGVAAGTYTNPTLTLDGKGRVAATGTGGGAGYPTVTYVAADTAEAFIDVKLDGDNGFAYSVKVKSQPNVDATFNFRISNDNGITHYIGASDFKHTTSGGTNAISLTNASTIGSGRNFRPASPSPGSTLRPMNALR